MIEANSIELRGVTKAYGENIALRNVSLCFAPGRVHALMGKNGSGKSTLIEILAGSIAPTLGEVWVGGRQVVLMDPGDALAAGIATVHQELSLVPSLTIAENIFLGRLPRRRRFGVTAVDWRRIRREAAVLLADMEVDLDADQRVDCLTVGQQQAVEIVKAAASNPKILLLDEPTSALAGHEVGQLFALIRRLRDRGVTIIYISHRMNELFEICDTCTVLRDGMLVGSVELAQSNPAEIVSMMFGERATHRINRSDLVRTTPVLSVEGLARGGVFSDISFALYPGEVLGFAGMLGSGRTEVLRAIFGADRPDRGRIVLRGQEVRNPTPRRMRDLGLAYTPEDRKHQSLVQTASISDNLVMANLSRIAPGGILRPRLQQGLVERQIANLQIKAADPGLPVSSLSGGNQQKVVVGNWLNTGPRVIFFDEPTRGIDLAAKQQIFDIVAAQSAAGVASVFVSSELEEVHSIAHRILVLHHGRIVGDIDPRHISLSDLYSYCMKGTLNV